MESARRRVGALNQTPGLTLSATADSGIGKHQAWANPDPCCLTPDRSILLVAYELICARRGSHVRRGPLRARRPTRVQNAGAFASADIRVSRGGAGLGLAPGHRATDAVAVDEFRHCQLQHARCEVAWRDHRHFYFM